MLLVASALASQAGQVPIDPLCSGVREGIARVTPSPPARVLPPRTGYCSVSTTAELRARVVDCRYADIVLQPGVYEPDDLAQPFLSLPQTRRLWGTTGQTTLHFGVSLGPHADTGLHGLVIDVLDPAHAVPVGPAALGNTAAVAFWGAASGVTLQDTDILGHGLVREGVFATYADGARVERVGVQGFLRYGVLLEQASAATVPATVRDLVVRDVADPAWQAEPWCDPDGLPAGCYAPGTAEAGLWIGLAALVERVQIRDVWWSGIETANCGTTCGDPLTGVQLWDVDIDRIGVGSGPAQAGVGVAFERVTRGAGLREFCIGPDTERGVHAEWNHGDDDQSAAALVIEGGVVSAHEAGVTFGSGTRDSAVIDVLFRNADWAGIGLECCRNADPDTCATNFFAALTFQIDAPDPSCEIAEIVDGGYLGACTCP
ncbi:MAG: hypothetical protein R3F59_08540 [Myxococcota bacterium]